MTALSPSAPDWPGLAHAQGELALYHCPLFRAVADLRGQLVYLATPYTKPVTGDDGTFDLNASYAAVTTAARWSAMFAAEGVTAVSPIVMAGEMVHADPFHGDLDPLDQGFWADWCRPLLRACRAVVVPPIPGADVSTGVWAEALDAVSRNRRVYLISPADRAAVFPGRAPSQPGG
ncbi:DUF1937 family protein [Mesobaculum littorinae]|uniref:DUF1937 family protein n=1 Tax=Mesobaculum littorinae TaxID=2486419 RepID=A0A438AME2_9RHOB|nr:DUF1937 family protein [Mesobaculum littorinae]RVV99716.1 DUF1937 family protein [Mesobaculum littorinae]